MKEVKSAFPEATSEIQNNNIGQTAHLKNLSTMTENGLDYELVGDYYFSLLTPPESPKVGSFGKAHFRYLRTEKRVLFNSLMLSGEMKEYLENIDRDAEEMFEKLIEQLAEQEDITEKLKAENQMLWVQKMCSICNRVLEIVNKELIYS